MKPKNKKLFWGNLLLTFSGVAVLLQLALISKCFIGGYGVGHPNFGPVGCAIGIPVYGMMDFWPIYAGVAAMFAVGFSLRVSGSVSQ